MSIEKFSSIFDGLKLAHGTYRVDGKSDKGKATGRAAIIREPRTNDTWVSHLEGRVSLGIIPINESNESVWGCIDIDQYPLDHKELVEKIRKLELPLVVCRSKSGGAHCFLFSKDWVAAADMQKALQQIAATLGLNGCEIFPKQVKLHLDRDDVGNFLNLPYFDAEDGLRYAIKDDGTSATLEEFIELYDVHVRTPEQVLQLQQESKSESLDLFADGPPCLNILARDKVSEGSRNNGLFDFGVYAKKAFPDKWEDKVLEYNMLYLESPLPLQEVNAVVKQLQKKDYIYRCNEAPIQPHCNKQLCLMRKFGVGNGAASNSVMANLRKYNSTPPVWFVDVNGEPLELDTEGLQNQTNFQKACVEQLNFFPMTLAKPQWEARVGNLLKDMVDSEGNIIEVAQDASIDGIFYDYLEEFCSHLQQAQDREEILLRKPWTDEEKNRTYFRLRDFENFLSRNKFFAYKTHKIAQRLRDIGGESTVVKIKNRSVRVYEIPAFVKDEVELNPPSFKSEHKVPF